MAPARPPALLLLAMTAVLTLPARHVAAVELRPRRSVVGTEIALGFDVARRTADPEEAAQRLRRRTANGRRFAAPTGVVVVARPLRRPRCMELSDWVLGRRPGRWKPVVGAIGGGAPPAWTQGFHRSDL